MSEDVSVAVQGGEKNREQEATSWTVVWEKGLFSIASMKSHGTRVIHAATGRTVDVRLPIEED